MTIDLNFLMFLIALIGCLGGAFAFFTKLLLRIEKSITELHTDVKNTKEHHNCEFNSVHKELDDMNNKLDDHETRIVKLEAKCK